MSESETTPSTGLSAEDFGGLTRSWVWLLALGLLFIAMGVVGLYMVGTLTLASVLIFGIMLLVGGGAQIVEAFQCKGWRAILWHVAIAVLYLFAGVAVIADPFGSTLILTYALALILIAIGVARAIMAFRIKGADGWGWSLVTGVLTVLLGVMILADWPYSGLWVIGMVIAVDLIAHGWANVWIALAARQAGREAAA